MIWFLLAVCSAFCLGCYDVLKKQSLRDNAVLPVLLWNTGICSILFLPLIILSALGKIPTDSHWYVPMLGWEAHRWVLLKAVIVLSSWICGYFAIKHLPLTIVGPINATRPVIVLMGALYFFQEHLNPWQWAGVLLAMISVFLLSRSGRKEGIHFFHNRWILLLAIAALLGGVSGLYDKFLLSVSTSRGLGLPAIFTQSWYNIYQLIMMAFIVAMIRRRQKEETTRFHWRWEIIGISLFLSAADIAYFSALSQEGALIAVISMTRRSSVLVSFLFAALFLREKNLRSKTIDLLLILTSMLLLCIGAMS